MAQPGYLLEYLQCNRFPMNTQVQNILLEDDARGESLLSLASTSGNKAAFHTMLGVLDEEVEENEVSG